MPNVAGVQFPYTPQGVQAAQLYQRSLSPRRGLGFRPIRMDNGGSADGPDIYFEFLDVLRDGDATSVMRWLTSGGNLAELNFSLDEHEKKTGDTGRRKQIEDAMRFAMDPPMSLSAITEGAAGADRELAGNLGRIEDSVAASPGYDTGDYFPPERPLDQREALRATGDTRLSDQDIAAAEALGFERYYGAEEARNQAGTGLPPYLGTITPVPRNFEREPYEGPDSDLYPPKPPITPPMFPATGKNFHPSYTGPSRFGAGGYASRGTVAGELEPRGYLTARQAGETMRERAKGLRDPRRYGGIGSLYNRYG